MTSSQLDHLLAHRSTLIERAQAMPLDERLAKAQEELAETIAAIARFRENPTPRRRAKLAEELVGSELTLDKLDAEFAEDKARELQCQLLKFRGALEEAGL
jgi:hypothetical protein